jgi:hypothetical protein
MPEQIITLEVPTRVEANEDISIVAFYTTDPIDTTLNALGFRVHFDSSQLTFNSADPFLDLGSLQTSPPQVFAEGSTAGDDDGDANTDTYILVLYLDQTGRFPNQDLPVDIYTANFTTADDFAGTTLNITSTTTGGQGFEDFVGESVEIDLAGPAQIIDLDGPDSALAEREVSITAVYNTDPLDNTLNALGFRLHFDSSQLTFDSVSDVFEAPSLQINPPQVFEEGSTPGDDDGDANTDSYVLILYLDQTGQFPNEELPLDIYTANFITTADFAGTTLNLTPTTTGGQGFEDFIGESKTIALGVNEVPVFDPDTYTFEIEENSAVGTVVGTVLATDPNDDPLTFAITSIDPDGDGNAAFVIDENTGEITVNDSDDLDFEQQPSFDLQATVTDVEGETDTANVTIDLTDVIEAPIAFNENNILSVFQDVRLEHTIDYATGRDTEQVNEIGLFLVDDGEGTIGGLSPSDPGYIDEILTGQKIVFSVLPNQGPEVLDLGVLSRLLGAEAGQQLAYFIVEDTTLDNIEAGLASSDSIRVGIENFDAEALDVAANNDGSFTLSFLGTETTITLEASDDPVTLGADLQEQREVIDLTGVAGATATLGLDGVQSKATFDNLIGMYRVDDVEGTINGIAPGDAGYLEAAIDRSVGDFVLRGGKVANTSAAEFGSVGLDGDAIYAPFVIANGGKLANFDEFLDLNSNAKPSQEPPEEILETDIVAYFPFIAANPDGADHIRLLGDNTFGFEDLPGGGDNDFNDVVFQVNLA